MGPKKNKKGGPGSPREETKGGGEKMTELDKEWYLIQIKSLGKYYIFTIKGAVSQDWEGMRNLLLVGCEVSLLLGVLLPE